MRRKTNDDGSMWGRCARELYSWYRWYNSMYLKGALVRPVIDLSDSEHRLGRWDGERRILAISREHVVRDPWLAVMETLRHEMAHQFAGEVLRAVDEAPHGPAFREACRRLRVDDRARGTGAEVTAPPGPEGGEQGVRRLVAKLLSLATSPNEHEAQAAMKKARGLILKHNVDVGEQPPGREFEVRQLGEVKARRHEYEYVLGGILSDFFFVEVIYNYSYSVRDARAGRVLQVYGTRFNVEMAEYVFGYLFRLLPTLWRDYRERERIAGDRDRLQFFSGVAQGFRRKLEDQDRRFRTELALVHQGDPELRTFCRWHNPQMRSSRVGGGRLRTRAWSDGVEEGRRLTLRRPLGDGTARRGRLLPRPAEE